MPEFSKTVSFWRGSLPHWEVVDGRYFVTLRQAGSLPREVEEELRAQLDGVCEHDWLARSRVYFRRLEAWLDRCRLTDGLLAIPDVARQIETTILTYEEIGYWKVLAYAVMPNHLHLFFRCGSLGLKGVMERFKRATARFIGRLECSAPKPFWQTEWFDHWSRSPQEDDRIESYIRNNPVRAGLVDEPKDWPWMRGCP